MKSTNDFIRKCDNYTFFVYLCTKTGNIMASHNELGAWGEEVAADYLKRKGYTILERDWKSGHRDIDIIAFKDNEVVFVEVKTRRNRIFGEPEEAIDYMKLRNLRAAINHYVKYKRLNFPIRLDAITIVGTPECGSPEVTHIKDFPMY
jgi:putative endonuclease